MDLEQVKEHFKYAKEVRCLADGKICDITKASNQGFYKNILDNIQVDGSVGDYNCLLYRENTNQLAEILTYIFDRGEEVIVWDEDGKEYIKPFVTFDLLNNPVVMTGEKDATSISFKQIRKLTPESLLEPQLTELKNKAKEMNCTITVIFEEK